MPKLPTYQSRVDPGLGNAGYLRPGVEAGPQADVAAGIQQVAQGFDAYGQAMQRIRSREDTISRAEAFTTFFETASAEYRTRLTEKKFTKQEDVLAFRNWLDEQSDKFISEYAGSEDSRARLAESIINTRSQLLDEAGIETISTQRAAIKFSLDQRIGRLTSDILSNPGQLATAFTAIDAAIDDVTDALRPEEDIELRALYRAHVVAADIEGMMARGAYGEARDLLTMPGVAESLPPRQQAAFRSRLETIDRQERERRNAVRSRLDDIAYALNTTADQLPMWARAQAAGIVLPTSAKPQAQSAAGKAIADRNNLVAEFGEDSSQVRYFDELTQGADEKPSLSDVAGIRKEYTALSLPFRETKAAYDKILTVARDPSPAGDLSLIFGYMKLLDPGSVVREGEFATAQNAGSAFDIVGNLYNRVMAGTRLTDQQRADFASRAEGLMQVHLSTQRRVEERFRGIAERAGINPEDIVIDFVGQGGEGGAAPAAPSGPAAGAGPSGATRSRRISYDLQGNRIGAGEPE